VDEIQAWAGSRRARRTPNEVLHLTGATGAFQDFKLPERPRQVSAALGDRSRRSHSAS
jgi:hypothetical protein